MYWDLWRSLESTNFGDWLIPFWHIWGFALFKVAFYSDFGITEISDFGDLGVKITIKAVIEITQNQESDKNAPRGDICAFFPYKSGAF